MGMPKCCGKGATKAYDPNTNRIKHTCKCCGSTWLEAEPHSEVLELLPPHLRFVQAIATLGYGQSKGGV